MEYKIYKHRSLVSLKLETGSFANFAQPCIFLNMQISFTFSSWFFQAEKFYSLAYASQTKFYVAFIK